jgi:hypothetical protein
MRDNGSVVKHFVKPRFDRLQRTEIEDPSILVAAIASEGKFESECITVKLRTMALSAPLSEYARETFLVPIGLANLEHLVVHILSSGADHMRATHQPNLNHFNFREPIEDHCSNILHEHAFSAD